MRGDDEPAPRPSSPALGDRAPGAISRASHPPPDGDGNQLPIMGTSIVAMRMCSESHVAPPL